MFKQLIFSALLITSSVLISCSDSLDSASEEFSEIEFMEPMTSALVALESSADVGNGIFIMHWDGLKPRFSDQAEDQLGMARAIGFETETELRPPHTTPTVDMGTVSIRSANGESIELTKQRSRFSREHLVYSNRKFGPFQERSTITFQAGGEYSIQTTGSDAFPALDLDVRAPEQKVNILSPDLDRLEEYSGNLELTWESDANKPVAIHIRPAFHPMNGQKPGPLNRKDSKLILLEENEGSYTISGETISEIAEKSEGNAVHVSVGQLHNNDLEVDGKTYRVLMRTGDGLVVELGS